MGSYQSYHYVPLDEEVESKSPTITPRRSTHSTVQHVLVYTLLIISNLTFFSLWLMKSDVDISHHVPNLIFSPARQDGAVSYVRRRLWRDIENNVFTGEPRPEHDAAWRHLIEPMTLKLSPEEASHLTESTIAFADGSGYIAEMAVYHELHCIKRIRRHFHLDRYYPDMSEVERVKEERHIDHCLEYWREAAMCRGDTSLATFQWVDEYPYSRVYSDHQCVDWEKLDGWARERMVNMTDNSQLAH